MNSISILTQIIIDKEIPAHIRALEQLIKDGWEISAFNINEFELTEFYLIRNFN